VEKLITEKNSAHALVYRAGGICALIITVCYVTGTILYVLGSSWPVGGESWLRYLTVHAGEWWAIMGLSVLADVLSVISVWALYLLLKSTNRDAMIVGCMLLLLYVALDLSITWPSFYTLLTLSEKYAVSAGETETRLIVANANGAYELLSSGWIVLYNILAPAVGILIIGVVMLRGHFSRIVGYLGVITGVVGIAAVVGPRILDDLSLLVIIASLMVTVWTFFVGMELLSWARKMGRLTPESFPADHADQGR
jgi:hypothetical protein